MLGLGLLSAASFRLCLTRTLLVLPDSVFQVGVWGYFCRAPRLNSSKRHEKAFGFIQCRMPLPIGPLAKNFTGSPCWSVPFTLAWTVNSSSTTCCDDSKSDKEGLNWRAFVSRCW